MNEILVLSRKKIEAMNFDGMDVCIISITDPFDNVAKISYDENKILRLQFHDVDKDGVIETILGTRQISAMTELQAKEIVDFVVKNKNVPYFIVHCEAGISRSSGITAGISKFIFGDDNYYFNSGKFIPNRHCHKLVLNEFYNKKEYLYNVR